MALDNYFPRPSPYDIFVLLIVDKQKLHEEVNQLVAHKRSFFQID